MKKKIILLIALIFCLSTTVHAEETTVYVTDNGTKYHRYGCSYLKSINQISLEAAVEEGYTPCSRCNPPVLDDYIYQDQEEGNSYYQSHSRESNNTSSEKTYYTNKNVEKILQDNIGNVTNPNPSTTLNTYEQYGSYEVWIESITIHLPGCPKCSNDYEINRLDIIPRTYIPCSDCQPLKYSSYEEFTESQFNILKIIFVGIGVAVFVMLVYGIIKTICPNFHKTIKQTNMSQSKISNTDNIDKQKFAKEYNYYFSLYAFYRPEDFVDIPPNSYIKNRLPYSKDKGSYGIYTAYITPNGEKYHQNKKCPHSPNTREVNIVYVAGHYIPCTKCVKKWFSLSWYIEYIRIINIKKKYNIP